MNVPAAGALIAYALSQAPLSTGEATAYRNRMVYSLSDEPFGLVQLSLIHI